MVCQLQQPQRHNNRQEQTAFPDLFVKLIITEKLLFSRKIFAFLQFFSCFLNFSTKKRNFCSSLLQTKNTRRSG